MTAYVVMQTSRSLAEQVVGSALASPESQAISKVLEEHDAVALPAFTPSAANPDEPVSLTIQVADMHQAGRLAASLRSQAGVLWAYAKPAESLP